MTKINKNSFLKAIKKNIKGAKESAKNYSVAVKSKSTRRKMVKKDARKKVEEKYGELAQTAQNIGLYKKEYKELKKKITKKNPNLLK